MFSITSLSSLTSGHPAPREAASYAETVVFPEQSILALVTPTFLNPLGFLCIFLDSLIHLQGLCQVYSNPYCPKEGNFFSPSFSVSAFCINFGILPRKMGITQKENSFKLV